jgi:putative flavoprotein involved in K+ transport
VMPVGRLSAVDGHRIHLGDNLLNDHLDAELAAIRFMDAADEHAYHADLELPEAPPRPPLGAPEWARSSPAELDLRATGIRTVLWATGFRRDFRWIQAPVFDDRDEPIHRRGVTAMPGLSFLGLSWLYRRASASIDGVGRDARYLAEVLTAGAPTATRALPAADPTRSLAVMGGSPASPG